MMHILKRNIKISHCLHIFCYFKVLFSGTEVDRSYDII